MGAQPGRPAEWHRGREFALQMLYQWEVGQTALDEVERSFWRLQGGDIPPEAQRRALELASGTIAQLDAIDGLIGAHTEHWRLERMAIVDRLVLRLATYELLRRAEPVAVVIDEAVELAKTFSSEVAAGFVNGVLDAVARELRSDTGPAQG